MKICFVNPSVGTTAGGTETTIRELARVLSERHEVWVLTGRSGFKETTPFEPRDRVRVLAVPYWPRFSPPNRLVTLALRWLDPYRIESASFFAATLADRKARRLLASSDVISTHFRVDSELFSFWARRKGVPSVFHAQGANLGNWFKIFDRSTRYVGVGELARASLEAKSGIKMHATVHPGIPEQLLARPRREADEVLFVGRLQPSKRADWAIRVFERITKDFPSLALTIVGDGPSRKDLEALAAELGVRERVRFTGEIPHEKVWDHYSRAKVLLVPSALESYSLVPLEAMAAGCPVIASDSLAMRESARPALFVPPEDMEAWVRATAELLQSAANRAKLAESCRTWAEAHGWRKIADAYEGELEAARRSLLSPRFA